MSGYVIVACAVAWIAAGLVLLTPFMLSSRISREEERIAGCWDETDAEYYGWPEDWRGEANGR